MLFLDMILLLSRSILRSKHIQSKQPPWWGRECFICGKGKKETGQHTSYRRQSHVCLWFFQRPNNFMGLFFCNIQHKECNFFPDSSSCLQPWLGTGKSPCLCFYGTGVQVTLKFRELLKVSLISLYTNCQYTFNTEASPCHVNILF